MTKKHFIRAAEIVQGYLVGGYSPIEYYNVEIEQHGNGNVCSRRVRAVWMAEAFIDLFSAYNDRFDRYRFLVACGLAEAPTKPKRGKA